MRAFIKGGSSVPQASVQSMELLIGEDAGRPRQGVSTIAKKSFHEKRHINRSFEDYWWRVTGLCCAG